MPNVLPTILIPYRHFPCNLLQNPDPIPYPLSTCDNNSPLSPNNTCRRRSPQHCSIQDGPSYQCSHPTLSETTMSTYPNMSFSTRILLAPAVWKGERKGE